MGAKKCYSIKYNEEFDYDRPEWNISDKCIVTKADGVEGTETYKRGCDLEGTWKPAAITGAEAHAEALGMTGAMKEQYLEGQMRETFTIERLVGGAMKITSDSPWLPGGVMVIKSGESYNLEIPGLGMTSGLGYEGCDEWIQTSKMMGKTVSNKEKITGDFMINEAVVDGCESSKQITIMTRH